VRPTLEEIKLFKTAKEKADEDSDPEEWNFLEEDNLKKTFLQSCPS